MVKSVLDEEAKCSVGGLERHGAATPVLTDGCGWVLQVRVARNEDR